MPCDSTGHNTYYSAQKGFLKVLGRTAHAAAAGVTVLARLFSLRGLLRAAGYPGGTRAVFG